MKARCRYDRGRISPLVIRAALYRRDISRENMRDIARSIGVGLRTLQVAMAEARAKERATDNV